MAGLPHTDPRWYQAPPPPRPRMWRDDLSQAKALLMLGLLGIAGLLLWLHLLAAGPHLPLRWPMTDGSAALLDSSPGPALAAWAGRPVLALVQPDGQGLAWAGLAQPRSGRWLPGDTARASRLAQRDQVARALQQPQLVWQFSSGESATAAVAQRGLAGLGATTWLLSGLALLLMLCAAVPLMSAPGLPAALFALMALAEALNLLLIGADLMPGLGLSAGLARLDLPLRWTADVVLPAALLHLAVLYPRRRLQARAVALAGWVLGASLLVGLLTGWLPGAWWWAQAWALGCGLLAAGLLRRAQRQRGGLQARRLSHLVLAAVLTLASLSAAIALTHPAALDGQAAAHAGAATWHLLVAMLMLAAPYLMRMRPFARAFAHLVAASPAGMSAERLFDSLYRLARALEPNPDQAERQIGALLREVFDPLELSYTARTASGVRVTQDGSTLVVPCPQIGSDGVPQPASGSIVLRHARQGKRQFSLDDRHLAERMIEQLSHAVAYDRAVERGRSEERTRLAQDLHDDIGARLLTLMYRAPNAEIEEYIRHTLQDLKTLTRGLAASNHRLSHAAAEWKADLSQRLAATDCDLRWSFSTDHDLTLNVVQWSGLTRVIRELVNNIISHARASQVEVSIQVDRGQLQLTIADDGIGRAPAGWSHGLGLGGVRKRVKLLGGQVQWLEIEPRGIRCEVRAPLAEARPS